MHSNFQWIGLLILLFVVAALIPMTKDGFAKLIKRSNDRIATERLKMTIIWFGLGMVLFASYVALRLVRNGTL